MAGLIDKSEAESPYEDIVATPKALMNKSGAMEKSELRDEKEATGLAPSHDNWQAFNTFECCEKETRNEWSFTYMQSAVGAQGREDVRQRNETVTEAVMIDSFDDVVLQICSRNGRLREVPVTLRPYFFRVAVFTREINEQEAILRVDFMVNRDEKCIWCKRSHSIFKNLLMVLKAEGVMFNLSRSDKYLANAMGNYILQMSAHEIPIIVPERHGWHMKKEEMKFCWNDETWKTLLEKCRF